jgi:hypothetical protein
MLKQFLTLLIVMSNKIFNRFFARVADKLYRAGLSDDPG